MDTVAAWLEEARAEAVRRIVERTRAELSDYRERDVEELSRAVGTAYDVWRRAVLTNDFDRHVAHARRVTRENLGRNIHPAQIARTPWLVYEVALAVLDEAEGRVNRMERAAFVGRAHHMTVRLTVAVNEEISTGLSAGLSKQPLPPLPPPTAAPEPETRPSRWA